jgi:choline dehydrogenase
MVSGIGPSSILSQYNITVLSDLPGVGQSLQDHPLAEIIHRVNVNTASKLVNDPAYAAQAGMDYLTNQTGPLTQPSSIIAWEKLPPSLLSNATLQKIATLTDDWPEIEYLAIDAYLGFNRQYETADPDDGFNYASLAFALQAPFSRGNVSISSDDVSDPPVINPNWLTDHADIDMMIAGFKRVRQVYAAIAEVTIGDEVLPGKNVTTDDQILEYIKEALVFIYHAAGTCAMGKEGDSMAVVDSKARVFGVNGVRVVDASVFPFLPAGHPQGTCYMLAEKIADDIKNGN